MKRLALTAYITVLKGGRGNPSILPEYLGFFGIHLLRLLGGVGVGSDN